jgi:hypothetical protein
MQTVTYGGEAVSVVDHKDLLRPPEYSLLVHSFMPSSFFHGTGYSFDTLHLTLQGRMT